MPWRMLEYCVRIRNLTGRIPIQFVLYFGWTKMRMHDTFTEGGIAFRYNLLDLHLLDRAALLHSAVPESNILALLANAHPQEVVETLRERLGGGTEEARSRMEAFFKVLCTLRGHDGSEVWDMPITEDDILATPILRKRVKKQVAEGEARGRAIGEVTGMAKLLLRQLELRFGQVPARTRTRLLNATPDQILEWSARSLQADSLATIFRAR